MQESERARRQIDLASRPEVGRFHRHLSVRTHVYWECLKALRIQELPSTILEDRKLCSKKDVSKISFPDARLLLLGQPPSVQLEPEQLDRLLEAGGE